MWYLDAVKPWLERPASELSRLVVSVWPPPSFKCQMRLGSRAHIDQKELSRLLLDVRDRGTSALECIVLTPTHYAYQEKPAYDHC